MEMKEGQPFGQPSLSYFLDYVKKAIN